MSTFDKPSPKQPELRGSGGFGIGSIGGEMLRLDPENKLDLKEKDKRIISVLLSAHPNPHDVVTDILKQLINDNNLSYRQIIEETKNKYQN